ncbi:MAG: hypothetical protein JKY42_12075 [Flavobacteriales bacterium]|nr:hypothetical protein [Flavobacteriales bacterium]
MVDLDFNTILDVSSIIWDREEYDKNKSFYYTLLPKLSALLIELDKAKTKIVIRNSLVNEMLREFPYSSIQGDFWASGNQVYAFLGGIGSKMINYDEIITEGLTSEPNQIQLYFKEDVKNEVNFLLSEIHNNVNDTNVFFSFKDLCCSTPLKTLIDDDSNSHKTIIADRGNELADFLSYFRLKFEHKPKHNKASYRTLEAWDECKNKGGFESQLSCYDGDPEFAQELLDNRYDKCFGNDFYYSYDYNNNFYVIFRITEKNIYHAYDMYDIQRIPEEVRTHFNIHKY